MLFFLSFSFLSNFYIFLKFSRLFSHASQNFLIQDPKHTWHHAHILHGHSHPTADNDGLTHLTLIPSLHNTQNPTPGMVVTNLYLEMIKMTLYLKPHELYVLDVNNTTLRIPDNT